LKKALAYNGDRRKKHEGINGFVENLVVCWSTADQADLDFVYGRKGGAVYFGKGLMISRWPGINNFILRRY
jgi:hypothetical protein